jgi:hypothetical protein
MHICGMEADGLKKTRSARQTIWRRLGDSQSPKRGDGAKI